MDKAIQNYAETLERERRRIADGLRGPLQNLGYGLRRISIAEGQGIVRRNGKCRETVSICISADEIIGVGE
jgi:hypothetical protein